VLSASIVVATVPPTGGITVSEDVVRTTELTVGLSWEGAAEMWVSEDPDADGPWVPVEASHTLELTGSDGSKTVYVRFRGPYGLVSEVYSATVILDREVPTLLLSSPAPDSVVHTKQLTVAGTVADANGVEVLEVSVDGGEWTIIPVQATWSTVVDLGDWGSHTLTFRAWDVAGNSAETSTQVRAEEEQSTLTSSGSLAMVLIVLILCVTAIVLVWMMKRGGPPLEDQ
jgi:hypothetical protein